MNESKAATYKVLKARLEKSNTQTVKVIHHMLLKDRPALIETLNKELTCFLQYVSEGLEDYKNGVIAIVVDTIRSRNKWIDEVKACDYHPSMNLTLTASRLKYISFNFLEKRSIDEHHELLKVLFTESNNAEADIIVAMSPLEGNIISNDYVGRARSSANGEDLRKKGLDALFEDIKCNIDSIKANPSKEKSMINFMFEYLEHRNNCLAAFLEDRRDRSECLEHLEAMANSREAFHMISYIRRDVPHPLFTHSIRLADFLIPCGDRDEVADAFDAILNEEPFIGTKTLIRHTSEGYVRADSTYEEISRDRNHIMGLLLKHKLKN